MPCGGWCSLTRARYALAQSDAEKVLAAGPADSLSSYLVRGRVRLQRGQQAAALADLAEADRLSQQKDALVLHWLATAQFGKRARLTRLSRHNARQCSCGPATRNCWPSCMSSNATKSRDEE